MRLDRLRDLLRSPRLPWLLAGLAALLSAPSLWVGWAMDDWVHQAVIRGRLGELGPRDPLWMLFTFMDGDPAHNTALRDLGVLPWWTPDGIRVSFWRPVTVLTHLLDHALAPHRAWLAHLHSIAWLSAFTAAAALLFRRVHGAGLTAGLAALLCAVDNSHALPVGWIANRNALIAATFAVLALLAHDRWRREGWRPGAAWGPGLLGLGLLAGETAIGALALLIAYALCLDPAPRGRRALSLLPWAGVVIAWRLGYNALGYGAQGSGLYLDPVRTPLSFAWAATQRLPVLLASWWSTTPAIPFSFVSAATAAVWVALALALIAGLLALLWPLLARSPTARFWALVMVLGAVPGCAAFPANRLMLLAGLGGAGLLAELMQRHQILIGAARPAPGVPGQPQVSPPARPPRARAAVVALAVLHLGLMPARLAVDAFTPRLAGDLLVHPCERALPRDASIADKTVVLVNSNDLCATHIRFARLARGEPYPRAVRLLTSAIYDVEVHGVDDHTVRVRPRPGFHASPADQLLRAADNPLPVGTRLRLSGVTIDITAHNARGLASEALFRFDRPLRDPSLLWRASRDWKPVVFVPPAPGETVVLPGAF